jgi:hypothetical protein
VANPQSHSRGFRFPDVDKHADLSRRICWALSLISQPDESGVLLFYIAMTLFAVPIYRVTDKVFCGDECRTDNAPVNFATCRQAAVRPKCVRHQIMVDLASSRDYPTGR